MSSERKPPHTKLQPLKEAGNRRGVAGDSPDGGGRRLLVRNLYLLCCGICGRWATGGGRDRRTALLRMTQDLQNASELEKRYVHQVYTQIAPHFNHTRYKAWPKVRQFLWALPGNSLVADVGCGNGKYCCVTHRLFVIGCDICPELAAIARAKTPNCDICLADNLGLPYKDNSFDALLSIAVIHHFATNRRREKALAEMARILRPGGRLMIYVWALEQSQRQFCAQDVLVPWHLQAQFKGVQQQGSVDSQNGNEVDPKRMLRADQLSVADRVIGGSIGMEPLENEQAETSISTDKQSLSNNSEQTLSVALDDEPVGWTKSLTQRFDKLFGLSPRLRKKQTDSQASQGFSTYHVTPVQETPTPPPAVPPSFSKSSDSGSENQLLHSQTNKEYLVAGVARFSPMLGRKLARVLGTPHPNALALENFAHRMAADCLRQGIEEFMLFTSFAKGNIA